MRPHANMQDADILQEFLVESAENLARLDREMVELEGCPVFEHGLLSDLEPAWKHPPAAAAPKPAPATPIHPAISGSP